MDTYDFFERKLKLSSDVCFSSKDRQIVAHGAPGQLALLLCREGKLQWVFVS